VRLAVAHDVVAKQNAAAASRATRLIGMLHGKPSHLRPAAFAAQLR
jgi:hypothetical protein